MQSVDFIYNCILIQSREFIDNSMIYVNRELLEFREICDGTLYTSVKKKKKT